MGGTLGDRNDRRVMRMRYAHKDSVEQTLDLRRRGAYESAGERNSRVARAFSLGPRTASFGRFGSLHARSVGGYDGVFPVC